MGYQKRRRYQRYRFDSRCQVRYNRVADNLLESDESFALNQMQKLFLQSVGQVTLLGINCPDWTCQEEAKQSGRDCLWSSFEVTGATANEEPTGLRSEVGPNKDLLLARTVPEVLMFISTLPTTVLTEKEFVAVDFVSLGPTAPCRIFLRPPSYG